jgi:hypothetical protein
VAANARQSGDGTSLVAAVMTPALSADPNEVCIAVAIPTAALPAATTDKSASRRRTSSSDSRAAAVTRRASTAARAAEVMAARCCRSRILMERILMELAGFGPHRQLCDDVELPKELSHHLAGIVSLAELFELRHDSRQRFFSLADGHV